MPGTIQVSVLDFVGLQPSSQPTKMSIKVSMGKREYQTWDKGDFSFPLTTLRDNLIVALHDAEGNEVSHSGVETRLVVEKGTWDDVFPLEGGGHVHMKLQFVLSDEDRQRIRTMRELALKKKHDELLKAEPRTPEHAKNIKFASSVQPKQEMSDSKRRLLQSDMVAIKPTRMSNPDSTLFKKGKSSPEDRKGFRPFQQKQTSPNDSDRDVDSTSNNPMSRGIGIYLKEEGHNSSIEKKETSSHSIDVSLRTTHWKEGSYVGSAGLEAGAAAKIPVKLKRVVVNDPEKQSPVEKIPSNVRNMISAFENSPNQDRNPKMRSVSTKSQSVRTGLEVPPRSLHSNDVKMEKNKQVQSDSGVRNRFSSSDHPKIQTHTRKGEEKIGPAREISGAMSSRNMGQFQELTTKYMQTTSADLVRPARGERRMPYKQLGTNLLSKFFSRKQHPGEDLSIKNSGKRSQPQNSNRVKNTEEVPGDNYYSSECLGSWIFPGEGRRVCLTTAGKQMVNLMGGFLPETNCEGGGLSSFPPENVKQSGTDSNVKQDEAPQRPRKAELDDTADDENSTGPVGQAMRVLIMVGFATLVLLTRQRKPRYTSLIIRLIFTLLMDTNLLSHDSHPKIGSSF